MRLAMLPGGALRIRVLRALAICLLAWLAPAIAFAQTPGDAAGGGRAQLEAGRLDLTQIEAALQRERLDDRRLDDLRKRLEPLARVVGELIGREQPKADEIKARIEKLGPAPDPAKGQTESPEVARDRAEQQRLFQEADETLRLARALSLRIEQAASAIADRRRGNFTREILAPGASILSPWLWLEATQALPSDLRALTFLGRQWLEAIAENLDWYEMVLIGLLLFAVLVGLPRLRLWVRSGQLSGTGEENGSPAPLRRAGSALRLIALTALAPALAIGLVYTLFDRFGILPGRAAPVLEAALWALAGYVFISGLVAAVLAPNRPEWRIAALGNRPARGFAQAARASAGLLAVGKLIEAVHGAIVAALPSTVATRGALAVLVGLALARGLHTAFGRMADDEVGEPVGGSALTSLRLIGWTSVLTLLGACALGYVAFASFLSQQLVWAMALALLAVLLLQLLESGLGEGLAADGLLGRRVRAATGLSPAALDQAAVLVAGLGRLVLLLVFGFLLLAPWGIDSSSFLGNLRAAFFGFQVGGVTISIATLLVAALLFVLGFAATRAIQNWLDTRYLPKTALDPGLRNSIRTVFGYIGILLAAILALSQLGLSLDKLTIVAGALSVGIGFGLQSIVNNFVSGLILLWERPIRVGDWIVVGDEQGTVKRINVRATEIQTFDRASLIIPNAEFISGRVKNWMHADRTGRIILPINVEYGSDPERVRALLLEAALANREVMSEPKPMVIFKNLGESGLDFELRCFVDVDSMLTARSDLLYDIYRRLNEAGIGIPYPTRRLEITNLGDLIPAQRPGRG